MRDLSVISIALLLFLGAGASCAGKNFPKEPSAEDIFARGMKAFTGGKVMGFISTRDYHQAAQIFQELLDKYPYSRFVPEAQLRLADSYFFLKEYDSAILVYDEFQRLRPSHSEVSYVLFQLGECYYLQALAIERDQTTVLHARKWFRELLKRYPKSQFAAEAAAKLKECQVRLARREVYVGKFYFRRGDYYAALGRFQTVVDQYPGSGLAAQALYYVGRCYQRLNDEKKRVEVFQRLRNDYPESSFARELED